MDPNHPAEETLIEIVGSQAGEQSSFYAKDENLALLMEANETPPAKIQEVRGSLRGHKKFEKYFEPKVASLGPIHHRNRKYKLGEKYKLKLAREYVKNCYENGVVSCMQINKLYQKIMENIEELKECFEKKVINKYKNDDLAWMLLVDGCAILQYIFSVAEDKLSELNIEDGSVTFAHQDLFLLENQVPFRLLKLLMSLSDKKDKLEESIGVFIGYETSVQMLKPPMQPVPTPSSMQPYAPPRPPRKQEEKKREEKKKEDTKDDKKDDMKVEPQLPPPPPWSWPPPPWAWPPPPWAWPPPPWAPPPPPPPPLPPPPPPPSRPPQSPLAPVMEEEPTHAAGPEEEPAQAAPPEEEPTQEAEPEVQPTQEAEPTHLLDLLRTRLLRDEESNTSSGKNSKKKQKHPHWQPFHNVQQLKAAGIRVRPSTSSNLRAVSFKRRWCFLGGELRLPQIKVDDSTGPIFMNLIAYEMCLDLNNDFLINSYMFLLRSLISNANDAKQLIEAGVLKNFLGSEEQVAKLFNEIVTDLVPYFKPYQEVRREIQDYCNNSWLVHIAKWITQLRQDYFGNPWSVIAFLAALLLLFLTATQTWFTVWSK